MIRRSYESLCKSNLFSLYEGFKTHIQHNFLSTGAAKGDIEVSSNPTLRDFMSLVFIP